VANIGCVAVVMGAFMATVTRSEGGGLRSYKGGKSIKGGARPLRSHYGAGGGRCGVGQQRRWLALLGQEEEEGGWVGGPKGQMGQLAAIFKLYLKI
jgi:hypothetical protein